MDVEQELRRFFRDEAERASIPPGMFDRVRRRSRIRRVLTLGLTSATALATVFAAMVGARALTMGLGPDRAVPGSSGVGELESKVVLSTGTIDGEAWSLVAYPSADGLCVDLEIEDGAMGGCGYDAPSGEDLAFSQGTLAGLDRTIVIGQVSRRVGSMEFRGDDGFAIMVDVIQGPPELEMDFCVIFLPRDAEGELVVRDLEGQVLQAEPIQPLRVNHEDVFSEEVIDEHKVVVYYPMEWIVQKTLAARGPSLPREIISVGTYPLRPGSDQCPVNPGRALEDLGPMDAFVTIQEATAGAAFDQRPRHFIPEQGTELPAPGCLDTLVEPFFRLFRFEDGGRSFLAYTAIGPDASEKTNEQVWQILDSFGVCDPSSPPGDCL